MADFTVVGSIVEVETIAEGPGIREVAQLRKRYGSGNWRKRKGIATIRDLDGSLCRVELHWYEAHGVGKVRMKIKRYLE